MIFILLYLINVCMIMYVYIYMCVHIYIYILERMAGNTKGRKEWCVSICAHVSLCVCMYLSLHVWAPGSLCAFLRICIHALYYVSTHVFMYASMYVSMYVCMYVCMYVGTQL